MLSGIWKVARTLERLLSRFSGCTCRLGIRQQTTVIYPMYPLIDSEGILFNLRTVA